MTLRAMRCVPVIVAVLATGVTAQQRGGRAATPAVPPSVVREAACVSGLGKGVKKGDEFCDVIIAATGADSVSMKIPDHTGPATLLFNLHPRFEVPAADGDPAAMFQGHTAVVAIVGPNGDVIDRVVAKGEFRSTADLYDRMAGAGPGGFKVVAPGVPTAVKVTIPAGVTSIGIVGLRVEITKRFGQVAFPEPGVPVAIVSNWQVQYIPR